jgi:prolyl-tRNA editing enzyme YbaK/EbsC (Cys-tRNA(Pro) deacylase)
VNERNSRVAAAVAAAGVEPKIKILDADARTAVAAAAQLGCEVGAMASGGHRVDTDLLARVLGAATISRATPQLVRTATNQVIGGVAPTGHPSTLRTVVDESLAEFPVIWTAAGTPDSVMALTYDELLAVTGGVAVQVR